MLCNFSAYLPPLNQCSNEKTNNKATTNPVLFCVRLSFVLGFPVESLFVPFGLGADPLNILGELGCPPPYPTL